MYMHRQANSSTRQAAMKSLLDLSINTPRVLHLRPLQLALEIIGKLNGTSELHSSQVKGNNLFIVYPVKSRQILGSFRLSILHRTLAGYQQHCASQSSELILCFSASSKVAISVTLEVMLNCCALFTYVLKAQIH